MDKKISIIFDDKSYEFDLSEFTDKEVGIISAKLRRGEVPVTSIEELTELLSSGALLNTPSIKLRRRRSERPRSTGYKTRAPTPPPSTGITYNLQSDINIFKDGMPTTMGIFGASKAGKSTLMMQIYKQNYNKAKYISILYSANPHISVYKGMKNLIIYDKFNSKAEDIIKMQHFINQNTGNRYSFLNMFDDIIDAKYKGILAELIMTYRNAGISSIISLQYMKLLSPQNRANINSMALFRFNEVGVVKALIDSFLYPYFAEILGPRATKNDMIQFYNDVTKDHSFIYLIPCQNKISFHKLKVK